MIIGVTVVLAALILPAQVVNDQWRPDEGSVTYVVPILDLAVMTPKELAMHYFTNLARMGYDCGTPALECGASASLPILSLDLKLSTAARWFSKHLNDTPCFQHDTCCVLTLAGDEVTCVAGTACTDQPCDSTQCTGTYWVERIALFGANTTAENLAAGNELAGSSLCQLMNSPGHRTNICTPTNTSLGVGYHAGENCWRHYWTQDFGAGSQAGRLYPGALFIDDTLRAGIVVKSVSPVHTAKVTIDSVPTALENTFGTDTRGAWSGPVTAAECASYFFTVSFNDGKEERFPPTGYLFNSENPVECEAPDGTPDSDITPPDTDNAGDPDDGQPDSAEQPDPDLPDDDVTIPYDFSPKDEDHPAPDYGSTDWDYIPPDGGYTHKDTGCGCALIL